MNGFFEILPSIFRDAFAGASDMMFSTGFLFLLVLALGIGLIFYLLGKATGSGAEDPYADEFEGDNELMADIALPVDNSDDDVVL